MLRFRLDASRAEPAYRQLCDQIVALVECGALAPGDRVPPTRTLARTVGLHRSTIVRAYEELRALGYLESRPGSYSTIRRRERQPTARANPSTDATKSSAVDWSAITRPAVRALRETAAMQPHRVPVSREIIDLDRLAADPLLAPVDELRRCIRTLLVRSAPETKLDYADAAGWKPLRDAIATRMSRHGVATMPEEIVVTNGAQHALDLVFRLLTVPGDQVVVEMPTYGMAHALLRLHELRPIEVPVREQGMDLDILARALERSKQRRPKLLYTMPTFHNPTGITTDQQHRERLLVLCEDHGIPLVEDGFEEEMKYFGRAVLPIKSMDNRQVVLYVGTLSKIVFPGLRIGWIAAPHDVAARLTDLLHASTIAGNTLSQAVAARFCVGGDFEMYLRRVHRVYRRRLRALLEGLDRHMPSGVTWTRPSGGYTVWVSLPRKVGSEAEVMEKLSRAGVKVGPGSRYCARPSSPPKLRLSIACESEARIEDGCRRLGRALASLRR